MKGRREKRLAPAGGRPLGQRILPRGELVALGQRGSSAYLFADVIHLKKRGGLLLTALFALGQAVADEAKPANPKAKLGTLIIEFDGLANDKGEVLAGLYNEAKKFPKENQALRNLKAKPVNKKCTIKTDKLPFGDYALAVMHDENKNGNMDYNVIVPKENTVFK